MPTRAYNQPMMTKNEAVTIFGTRRKITDALGISRQAVSQWPETLPQRLSDELIGAAVRVGIYRIKKVGK